MLASRACFRVGNSIWLLRIWAQKVGVVYYLGGEIRVGMCTPKSRWMMELVLKGFSRRVAATPLELHVHRFIRGLGWNLWFHWNGGGDSWDNHHPWWLSKGSHQRVKLLGLWNWTQIVLIKSQFRGFIFRGPDKIWNEWLVRIRFGMNGSWE